MRARLFWKILFAFWLTFICIILGLWFLFVANSDAPRSREQANAERIAPPVLALLAHTVETEGLSGYGAAHRSLPPAVIDHIGIAVMDGALPGSADHRTALLARKAIAPDGHPYRLFYHYELPRPFGLLDLPWQLLLVIAIASSLFSVFLAWYLTRPIKLLRDGFNRMAQGDLDVRLEHRVGRRRDEIADLAKHFDQMAVRLGQLVTTRDRLLHDVSHELRSPLSRLQLAIGLARQDPQRLEGSLDRIEHEATRLDALVRELLILARAESGADQIDEYFDPVAALESVLADASFEAQAKGTRIEVTLPEMASEDRPSVKGSAELFCRAIENVLRNALRFSPENGVVDVRIDFEAASQTYRFRIGDQGPGVSPADFKTLFDPFVRADRAGFGLGLAIAERAVNAHDGTIAARNKPSGGLLVEVTVPTRLFVSGDLA